MIEKRRDILTERLWVYIDREFGELAVPGHAERWDEAFLAEVGNSNGESSWVAHSEMTKDHCVLWRQDCRRARKRGVTWLGGLRIHTSQVRTTCLSFCP